MNSFWVCLIGFVLMIQTSTALRCYSCNSKTSTNCENPVDKIQPEECTLAGAGAAIQNTFKNLASSVFNVDEGTSRPVCQKAVVLVNNERIIDRSCSIKSSARDICAEIRKGNNVESCEICETEACNEAVSIKNLWLPMILMPALATIFKTFV